MNKLYPYQDAGVAFLAGKKRAYLADDMGLGKTVQAIVAAKYAGIFDVVIVCPASVRENWKREWEAWGGPCRPIVMSYSELIRNPPFVGVPQLVILDEAHYCKSPGAKRTKAALKLAAAAPSAWLLSGTPMPNDPRELYAVFKYLWPGAFPELNTQFKWMDRFCLWGDSEWGYRVWAVKPAAMLHLVPAMREFMLRRRLKDIALELPSLRFTVQSLDKDPVLAGAIEYLAGEGDNPEHMSTMRRLLGAYKAPKVAKIILEEMDEDQYDSIVVMYHHHDTEAALYAVFEPAVGDARIHGFNGATPALQRQKHIDAFQQEGGIFLAQQGAAGIGITLTRSSEIVLVEPSWSPEDNWQAIKRIHRIGQDAPCRARMFSSVYWHYS